MNPFRLTYGFAVSASDRMFAVRSFDADQCQAALQVPCLQRCVLRAIQRRLRQLESAPATKPREGEESHAGDQF
jgi:hypothetical protein